MYQAELFRVLQRTVSTLVNDAFASVFPKVSADGSVRAYNAFLHTRNVVMFVMFMMLAATLSPQLPFMFLVAMLVIIAYHVRQDRQRFTEGLKGFQVLDPSTEAPALFETLRIACLSTGIPVPQVYVPVRPFVGSHPVQNVHVSWAPGFEPAIFFNDFLLRTMPEHAPAIVSHEVGHIVQRDSLHYLLQRIGDATISTMATASAITGAFHITEAVATGHAPSLDVIAAFVLGTVFAVTLRHVRPTFVMSVFYAGEFGADRFAAEIVGAKAVMEMLGDVAGSRWRAQITPELDCASATHPAAEARIELLRLSLPADEPAEDDSVL